MLERTKFHWVTASNLKKTPHQEGDYPCTSRGATYLQRCSNTMGDGGRGASWGGENAAIVEVVPHTTLRFYTHPHQQLPTTKGKDKRISKRFH
jgi:hypothetical protein